ncbi:trehalose-6-phosphate synthase [Striga asiatica]|uniref:Trehalose-6-phosphate synthase n=1 Tax=Striga asiatica TaxID=4170 RepID=A0A5A7Q4M5_STRAF|nr:trehalose-6-phosphate synthase [Striga asiatica]
MSGTPVEFPQHTAADSLNLTELTQKLDTHDKRKIQSTIDGLELQRYRRNALRRSRVSTAILPLLGSPSRTSFLSCFLPTFPLTTVAGDATEQHETNFREEESLKRYDGVWNDGVEPSGRCRKTVRTKAISTNLSSLSHSVTVEKLLNQAISNRPPPLYSKQV